MRRAASRAASLFVRPEKRRSALTLASDRGGPTHSDIAPINDRHPADSDAWCDLRSDRREEPRCAAFFLKHDGPTPTAHCARRRPSKTRKLVVAGVSAEAVTRRRRKPDLSTTINAPSFPASLIRLWAISSLAAVTRRSGRNRADDDAPGASFFNACQHGSRMCASRRSGCIRPFLDFV